MEEGGAACCFFDLEGRPGPQAETADFVYLRLHGPGSAYRGSYGGEALASWATRIRGWLREGKEVFCFFDNDEGGYVALNAWSLRELLAETAR